MREVKCVYLMSLCLDHYSATEIGANDADNIMYTAMIQAKEILMNYSTTSGFPDISIPHEGTEKETCEVCGSLLSFYPDSPLQALCATCGEVSDRCCMSLRLANLLSTNESVSRCILCARVIIYSPTERMNVNNLKMSTHEGREPFSWINFVNPSNLCPFCGIPMTNID